MGWAHVIILWTKHTDCPMSKTDDKDVFWGSLVVVNVPLWWGCAVCRGEAWASNKPLYFPLHFAGTETFLRNNIC